MINSLSFWFSHFTNFYYILFFSLIKFCKPCVIGCLVRNFSSFLLSFLSGASISNRPSILDSYWFIENLTSLFSLHRIWLQSVWLKSEINLLLSNFLQSCFNTLNFTAVIFEKKSFNKINCGRWTENVDVTLPVSISSKDSCR